MKDAKGLHAEILERESHDYRDGWQSTGEHAIYWMCVGACITLGIWFLVTGS